MLFEWKTCQPRNTWCSIIKQTPSFQRHKLILVLINRQYAVYEYWQFMSTNISTPQQEIMLCEVLSEFPHPVLPLPCNVCISVTSF